MAKYSNTIEYNISTKLDPKGLTQLQQQLKQIEISIQKMDNAGSLNSKIADARTQIKGLGNALSEAFNPSLGMVDLAKFNTALKENGVSAAELRNAFQLAGADGQVAFNNLVGQLGQLDLGLKRSSSSLNKIATTFGNTFRWGVIASFFSQFMNAIHSSVDYVKELDDSLTQIMLVTDYNRDSMNAYAKAANEAAKAVGQTTVGMTNASLIFAQQGYDLTQSQELATLSAKLANASQQDTATTSDQITAYMNAYGLSDSIEDLSAALDSWALVANVSAADVAELATASQKAASTANSVGVNMDQLNAQIATIESVTRDAPEQIGNGLKTLYARFSDIKLGKTLEDGVNLGQVTGQLNKLGVQVLDQFGNIRDVGDILEDLMVIWDDLDQTTKEASAQTLAGKFQMNRFLALMDNSDMYREYLGASENAAGTLDQMNAEYLDSLEGRTARIQASLEGIFSSIFDTDVVYPFIDAMQKFLDILQTLIDSLGGGSTIVLGLVSAFTQLFSNQIAQGINDFNINQAISKQRQENYQNSAATLDRLGAINPNPNDENSQAILSYARKINESQPYLNQEQAQQANSVLVEMIKNTNDLTLAQEKLQNQMDAVGTIASAIFDESLMSPFKEENTIIYTDLSEHLKGLTGELQGSGQSINDIRAALELFQNEITETSQTSEGLKEKWQMLQDVLKNTSYGEFVSKTLEKLGSKAELSSTDLADLTNKTQNLLEALKQFKNGDISVDQLFKELEKLDQLNANVEMKKSTVEGTQKVAGAVEQGIDSQQQIKQIVDTVGALGQLAFAIQSVQNLGSIWKNENLTTGEKIIQTITNLSMVIPSVISSFQTLQKTQLAIDLAEKGNILTAGSLAMAKEIEKKATEDLIRAEEHLAKARRMSVAGAEGERRASEINAAKKEIEAAQKAVDNAQKGIDEAGATATTGIKGFINSLAGLGKAFLALPIPMQIAMGVLTAFAIGLSIVTHNAAESRQAILDTFNDLTDRLENIDSSIENFETLKKTFDETGQVSDELKESARKLAEELGVTGAEAYIAAGNFDLLAEKILAARDAQNQEVITQGAAAIEAASNDYGVLNTFFGYNTNRQLENAVIGNSYVTAALQETSFSEEEDPTKKIGAIQQALQDLNEQFRQATPGTQEYTDLAAAINLLNEALEKENVSTIIEQAEAMKEAALASSDFSEGLKTAAEQGPAAMRAFIESYDGLVPYLNTLADSDNFISGLMTDYGTQYNDLFSILGDLNEAGKRTINLENLPEDFDPTKYSNLSQEDWEALGFSSYEAFLGAFNRAQEYQPLEIKPVLEDDMLHYSEDEITEIMNRAGLEGISLDDYVQSFKVSGGAGIDSGEINTLSEEVDDLRVKYEEAAETAREFREAGLDEEYPETYAALVGEMSELEASLDTAQDRMEQLAIAALETSNGMDELSENWKNINDSIQNGNPGEVAAGYSQLQNILAQILNVDPSAITQNFMQSEEALTAIADLANGDTDAIYRLREAFADPLTVQTYLDTIGFQGDANELLNLVSYAQDALPDLEVGASLDDEDFINALENMVLSGQLAAEDVQNIFNGMGYNVQVEYSPMWFPNVEGETESSVSTDGATNIRGKTSLVHKQVGGTLVQIPHFRFVKTGGNSGGHSYRSNTGGSGSGGRGGGGKGGKGKGGKGSKAKAIEPKEEKEHEKDYYEEVNSQLDKTEKILSRIEKEEDRLIGDKARANQNKQLDLLQKEIDLNEEKLKINRQELKDVDEKLKQQDRLAEQILQQQGISMLIPEPVFDEDGVIANYEQISKALDDAYNELVKKYNAAATAGNEELAKAIEEQINQFDEYSKNLLDSAKRHNALQSEIEETTNALEELKNAIEDIRIAAYKASLEMAEKFRDVVEQGAQMQSFFRDFDPNSFMNRFSIDETPYDHLIENLAELETLYNQNEEAAKQFYNTIIEEKRQEFAQATSKEEKDAIEASIQYFIKERDKGTNNEIDFWRNRVAELEEWMNNPKAKDNPFGDNTAALKEAYEDAVKHAFESAQNFQKILQNVRNNLIDIYDTQEDALDREMKKYDRLLDKLERVNDTYALYYGEDDYQQILNIMQQQGNVMQKQLTDLTENYHYWEQKYQEALKTGDEKLAQEIEDKMNDAEEAMLDKAADLAEHWVEMFEKTIDSSMQNMTDKVWGKTTATLNLDGSLSNIQLGLDDLETKWELEKQYMEDYKDEVEKAYEIDKLRNKYIDLLNDAQGASLGTQNKIRQQMEEQLKYLENQATVSEYDVKLANAKLEILQKQIALEDAQRNKNKMQLRRDTQGNYRYVYRADEGDVKKAQDELLDSSFDAYELTKDQTITNNDRALNLYRDMLEKMSAASKKYKDDEIAQQAALQEIIEQYRKMFEALGEDFDDVTNGMYEVLCWNIENSIDDTSAAAIAMLDTLYDKNGQIKENTGIMYRDLATQINEDVINNINDLAQETILDINLATKKLKENITSSLVIIGSDINDLDITLAQTIEIVNKLKEANDNLFEAFTGDSDINKALNALSSYSKALEDTRNKASALANQLTEANKTIANLTAKETSNALSMGNSSGSKKTGSNGNSTNRNGGSVGGSGSNGSGGSGGSGGGSGGSGGGSGGSGGGSKFDKQSVKDLFKSVFTGAFTGATGGYTGSWNDGMTDGKLAILHEKELVLNAKDTENILNAVAVMRNMVSTIQTGTLNKVINSNISKANKNFGDTIEQRVEINATFPNVTNSDEIEAALLGLSDKAYQYSYRTR